MPYELVSRVMVNLIHASLHILLTACLATVCLSCNIELHALAEHFIVVEYWHLTLS